MMVDDGRPDCIVVGAGPAGLVLSILLARQGVKVILLEMREDLRKYFRGDIVHPSTLQVLSDLGWADEFLQFPHGVSDRLWQFDRGKPFALADFRKSNSKWPYAVFGRQWQLLELLKSKADTCPTLEIRMGCRVVGLIQDEGRCLGVRWARGGDEGAARGRSGWSSIDHSP